MGVAELHHAGALGVFDNTAFQSDGAQFVGRATAWAHGKPPEIPGNPDLALLLGGWDGSGKGRSRADKDVARMRLVMTQDDGQL
jgi:hypothetical protein